MLVGATAPNFSSSGRGVIEINGTSDSLLGFNRASSTSAYIWATSSSFRIINKEANPITFSTTEIERARIPAAGGFQSVGSISVGNATPTTSGAGITFPATQSASTDANTLDDYEEGTFTPTVSGVTLSSSSGTYTKIGRQVFVSFDITWPTNTNTTAITIGAMPFAPVTNSGAMSTGYSTYSSALIGMSGASGIALYGYLGNPASAPQNIHLSGLRLIASATYTV